MVWKKIGIYSTNIRSLVRNLSCELRSVTEFVQEHVELHNLDLEFIGTSYQCLPKSSQRKEAVEKADGGCEHARHPASDA